MSISLSDNQIKIRHDLQQLTLRLFTLIESAHGPKMAHIAAKDIHDHYRVRAIRDQERLARMTAAQSRK